MKKIMFLVALVCSFGAMSYANSKVEEVYTSSFPILINGENYTPEMPVLNYEGRTYLALREFGTVTGNEIDFKDNTIIINTTASDEQQVYLTRTGVKYHYDSSCNGGTYMKTTLEDALKFGLEPCEKCVNK